MTDFRTEAFRFKHVHEPREALDLDIGFRVPRHVGCGEVREHAFELETLEAERRADVVEVLGIETVAVHAGINRQMRLAGRARFLEELVERHGRANVRNGGSELEFDEVGEVCGRAGAENQDGQVHAVLAKQHPFADVGDSEVVSATELGGKRAGETPVSVGIGLHWQENLRVRGYLAADKLNVIAEGVQVDFNPVRACDLV